LPHNSCKWWLGAELNRRHKDFQSSALPTELPSQLPEITAEPAQYTTHAQKPAASNFVNRSRHRNHPFSITGRHVLLRILHDVACCHHSCDLEWLGSIERMSLHPDSTIDNLARMSRAIQNDQKLREWFGDLADMSEVERRNKIYSAAEQIRAEGKDADLAASFHLLADARVFEATRLAMTGFPTPKRF
jgi:hypothetical protein